MSKGFQRIKLAVKRTKFGYYAKNAIRQMIPALLYRRALNRRLLTSGLDKNYLAYRVNYYNKLASTAHLGQNAVALKDVKVFGQFKTYKFDAYEHTRYFDQTLKANFLNGDVNHVNSVPTIQKSRPIDCDNTNAILLKLDKKRHFFFVTDEVKFSEKKDMLIGRGAITQPHRIRFMEMYFNHPLCDLGQVNKQGGNPAWIKPKISIADHLAYKFILSLEGNDVATNLKWIMSSNSIAVMPAPKFETWFMEGRLVADYHYIAIKDDYSDLEEKLQYYINRPAEAERIIQNANEFVRPFMNNAQEDLIALLVLEKYFYYTSQKNEAVIL